jgi:hypothetical protein
MNLTVRYRGILSKICESVRFKLTIDGIAKLSWCVWEHINSYYILLLPVRQWISFEVHQIHIMVSLSVRLSAVTSNSLLSRAYIHIQHFAMGGRTLYEFACKIWVNDASILLDATDVYWEMEF